jgi:hypothetical protein
MVPLDPFMGMMSLRSRGVKLPERGIHLRFGTSRLAGYPRYGFSLYRLPADIAKTNFPVSIRFFEAQAYSGAMALDMNFFDFPPSLHLLRNFNDGEQRALLVHGGAPLEFRFRGECRAFQCVMLGCGSEFTIEISTGPFDTEEHRFSLRKGAERPFYFESERRIKRLRILSPGVLVLELEFLRQGVSSLGLQQIARLRLPETQRDVDERVRGVAEVGRVDVAGFDFVRELLARTDPEGPIAEQAVAQIQENAPAGQSPAKYMANPHDLLNTMCVHHVVARAAGLYFVDAVDPTSPGAYLLFGNWGKDLFNRGFVWYQVPDMIYDGDPFAAPSDLRAFAIDARAKEASPPTQRTGTVGIGLKWSLPERTQGRPQNHAARYQITRKPAAGASAANRSREIVTGYYTDPQEGFVAPEFQFVDFGDADAGLTGTYSYDVVGIDLFGRKSDIASTETVKARSRTIPPPPVRVEASLDTPEKGLTVVFAWTLREHAADPDVRKFRIHADIRQPSPVTGRIQSVSRSGGTVDIAVAPPATGLGSDAAFVNGLSGDLSYLEGGMLKVHDRFFAISTVEASVPPTFRIAAPDDFPGPLLADAPCAISANWLDPRKWRRQLATVELDPHPEQATVDAVVPIMQDVKDEAGNVTGQVLAFDNLMRLTLTAAAFAGRPATVPDAVNAEVRLSAATLLQNGHEFALYPDPSADPADKARVFNVACLFDESGQPLLDGDNNRIFPLDGLATVFPRVTLTLPDCDISGVDNTNDKPRKRMAIGVSAIDDPTDGANEGAVSRRVTCEWISTAEPAIGTFDAQPDLQATDAEPADADGRSRYLVRWPTLHKAEKYNIYRATEQGLIDVDIARRGGGGSAGDYADKTLYELWLIANVEANLAGFRRLNTEPIEAAPGMAEVTYLDRTLPGYASGHFFYRVQGISATGVRGPLSEALTPVRCPPARQPSKPALHKYRSFGKSDDADRFKVALYWRAAQSPTLSYFVIYKTREPDVAANRIWRYFDKPALRVLPNESVRPLEVEFGRVDLSRFDSVRNGTVLGIFERGAYNAYLATSGVDPASLPDGLIDYSVGPATAGRVQVNGLQDFSPVVCYYESDGVIGRIIDIPSERMKVISGLDVGPPYFFCLASVDISGKLSELSQPLRITVGP